MTTPSWAQRELGRRHLLGWTLAAAAVGGLGAAGIPALSQKSWAAGPAQDVPGGTFTDLGPAVPALTLMRGVVGRNAAGQPVLFSVPAGVDAHLNGINLITRELEVDVPMVGASGSWSQAVASDGRIYVGPYTNGHLYRYDPVTKVMDDLGNAAGESYLYGVTPGKDGKVYAGTYPNAKVIEYDPATNQIRDFGSTSTLQKYVRGLGYDSDREALYAGLYTPRPNLVRIDIATGAHTDVTPAGIPAGTGISEVKYLAGTVFFSVDTKMCAMDPETGALKQFTNGDTGETVPYVLVGSRYLSALRNGVVHFTGGTFKLTTLDPVTLTFREVKDANGASFPGSVSAMSLDWITTADGREVLTGINGNYSGNIYEYDPAAHTVTGWTAPFHWVPQSLIQILPGLAGSPFAGKVFNNAYLNGSGSVYDIAAGTFTATPRPGQVENWTWHDDKIWMGVYPTGSIKVWDPAVAGSTSNPRTLFALKEPHAQIRPQAMVSTADRLYIGTAPDYGQTGGALTIMRYDDESYQVFRHIVADQTICAIAIDEAPSTPVGYGGSSITAGTGGDPVATEAKLFRFDPVTGVKTGEWAPVPKAYSVNELSIGPDGRLWGLADGTLFVFDQDSESFVAKLVLRAGTVGSNSGEFVWHPNGHLYLTTMDRLWDVDPLAFTATLVMGSRVSRARLGADDKVYLMYRPEGQSEATDLGVYAPSNAAARPDDLRATVLVGTVDSTVRNRFVTDGTTLADQVPDERNWASHGDFLAAFVVVTKGWVRKGWITAAERDLLLDAAGRSDVGN